MIGDFKWVRGLKRGVDSILISSGTCFFNSKYRFLSHGLAAVGGVACLDSDLDAETKTRASDGFGPEMDLCRVGARILQSVREGTGREVEVELNEWNQLI